MVEDLKNTTVKFSLQLDESTDVSSCSQLLVYVRYLKDESIRQEFLFCKPLEMRTRAVDVFNKVQGFFEEHDLDLTKIGAICTDGAPAMLGRKSGFAALVKEIIPDLEVHHCFIHRQSLAAKTLPTNLNSVLQSVVKAVNYIRSRALNHRLFQDLCREMGATHTVLLFHTEVRWLSRGRVLRRIHDLLDEVTIFLQGQEHALAGLFQTELFKYQVAYLADIFEHLNDLNLTLQGKTINIITAGEKIEGFKRKLVLWRKRIANNNVVNFSSLSQLSDDQLSSLTPDIAEHLTNLTNAFNDYFPISDRSNHLWVVDPFTASTSVFSDDDPSQDELLMLQAALTEKQRFQSLQLESFWCSQMKSYPSLAERAIKILIPFVSTYLCEAGFSTLLHIKTKQRNRLDPERDMRVALSQKHPRLEKLLKSKQQQKSH